MKACGIRWIAIFLFILSTLENADAGPGAWDRSYAPLVTGGVVNALALQTDGKLLVGGTFVSVNGSSARARLARLLSDGSLDTTFFNTGSGLSNPIWTLVVQTDNRIIIGGDFTSINGTTRTRVARLNSNGTVDGSFIPTNNINNSVLAIAVQSNNAVIIGGNFSQGPFPSWNARLNPDGTTDNSFSSFPNGPVYAIAIQPDGKIVIGGAFTSVNGATRNRIARLNADGSLDNTFQNSAAGASSSVRCVQVQPDGKILIGGDFSAVNGSSRNFITRLNADGSLDTGFANSISVGGVVGPSGSVYVMALQPDNDVIVGGNFTAYAGFNRSHIARIYPDGTLDTTYTNFGINNIVQALAVQTDGATLIGGSFTTINNTNWSSLARLYGDLYPPEFISQPVSRNTNIGANVTFSAQVSNPTSTSFQWRKDGNNIPNATGTSYSLFNVQLSDTGNYSVFVSDAIGGVTSSNALLQVGITPAFTSQASSLTLTQGQSASFSVSATGTPLNYFWKKNGTFITGQTNFTLNFASVVPTNAATYTCQVSNFLGSITSTGAVLTVVFSPTISVQPVGQTVGVGSNFTVSVTASGNPAVTYQWRTNGTAILGATISSYTVTGAQTSDSADYDVVITNSIGSITSIVATVSVVYYPPTISQQPVGGNVLVDSNFNLSVSASGTAPFTWQWRTNGTPIPGANASSYAIIAAQLTDGGSYDVVVTNSTGSVTSSVAVVNVGYAPVVVQQPLALTNIVGGTTNFSCIVTGSDPIILQWTFNGNPLTDATNSMLTLTNLQPGDIGYYALTATNIFGGTVSSNAALNLIGYDFGILDGLVAYYPFNGDPNDASGNGNDGTVFGAALTPDRFGISNACYSFNAISNFISIPDFTQADASTHTLSFWILANSWTNVFQTASVDLLGKDNLNPGTRQWVCQGLPTGQIRSAVFTSTGEYDLDSTTQLQTNQWYQVVAVWDGTNEFVYINGKFDNSLAAPGTLIQGNAPVRIGGDPIGQQSFGGNIDDVRIYNRALSSDDVASLYALESQSTSLLPFTLSANLASGANLNLNLTGQPGRSYILLSTTNLQPPIQWVPVLTNAADTNGVWQFVDTNLDSPQKFYRVVTP